MRVLAFLEENKGVTPYSIRNISRRLGVHYCYIWRAINYLYANGYVGYINTTNKNGGKKYFYIKGFDDLKKKFK